jgi:hypothetical protein
MAAVRNEHKLEELKQQKFILAALQAQDLK